MLWCVCRVAPAQEKLKSLFQKHQADEQGSTFETVMEVGLCCAIDRMRDRPIAWLWPLRLRLCHLADRRCMLCSASLFPPFHPRTQRLKAKVAADVADYKQRAAGNKPGGPAKREAIKDKEGKEGKEGAAETKVKAEPGDDEDGGVRLAVAFPLFGSPSRLMSLCRCCRLSADESMSSQSQGSGKGSGSASPSVDAARGEVLTADGRHKFKYTVRWSLFAPDISTAVEMNAALNRPAHAKWVGCPVRLSALLRLNDSWPLFSAVLLVCRLLEKDREKEEAKERTTLLQEVC